MDNNNRIQKARNRRTSPSELAQLAQDKDWRVREAVAEHPQTPVKELTQLARDKRWEVRKAVARNPQVPPEVLTRLAEDEAFHARYAVAENPKTPEGVLTQLARDERWEVRLAVAKHPQTPVQVLTQLAQNKRVSLSLTYEYKLKPTKQQAEQIDHYLEVCRRVWNDALREHKDWMASRKCPVNACSLRMEYILPADAPYPSFPVQCQRLTEAKRLNADLASVNAQVLQQVLRRLDQAFERRKKLGAGFPRFKKPGQMRSFCFPQLGKDPLRNGAVKLPGLGWTAIRQSRPYPDGFVVKQARVVKRASGYYLLLTFQADVAIPEPPLVGHVVGVDVGLEYFLSTSDGLQLERPKFFVNLQRKLKLLQRRLKRKQLGSANWKKAQLKVAKLHEHIANARKDFHFKVAHHLCDVADVLIVEDLNLSLRRGKPNSPQSRNVG
ncbi:RNA-guided endonuclease TnpB family protein [uncultured Thermosynechococcus sp.]|uniref:RNA-guided endonuclease TnpB family protein n=1 Tax=uncultured Thermosynechococcus sp. TaxID=436945 RepID=UPI002617D811|nr:RNA-guided endonuclease TnpB family protein [uncultured Thermosynechococcus sp.]